MDNRIEAVKQGRDYFPALDGLRFVSILFVVLHHLDTFRANFEPVSISYPILGEIGYFSIQFFFVGSGFLITYFLLVEMQDRGSVSVRDYFMRRVLRIWPGYYLLLLLAALMYLIYPLFSIPGISSSFYSSEGFGYAAICFFGFLPHLPAFFSPTAPYIHQTYTIGIEEQFYLVWGLVFWAFRRRGILVVGVMGILVMLFQVWHDLYFHFYGPPPAGSWQSVLTGAATFLRYSRLTSFAIGSLFAVAYLNRAKWLRFYSDARFRYISYGILILSVLAGHRNILVSDEWISFLMISILFFSIHSTGGLFSFAQPWLVFLGRISYGIYLFHLFAIVIAVKCMDLIPIANPHLSFFILSVMAVSLSIFFGWLSYKYVEQRFLSLKQNFRSVQRN